MGSYQQARPCAGLTVEPVPAVLGLGGSGGAGGRALQAPAQLKVEAVGSGVEGLGQAAGEPEHVGHHADTLPQPGEVVGRRGGGRADSVSPVSPTKPPRRGVWKVMPQALGVLERVPNLREEVPQLLHPSERCSIVTLWLSCGGSPV